MYKVYFENRFGERIYIGNAKDIDEIHQVWRADLDKRNPNYKVYYIRHWIDSAATIHVDIGSHTEFYIAVPVS